jgi:hypothetical protein
MTARGFIVLAACPGLFLIATGTLAAPEKSRGKQKVTLEEKLKQVLNERVRIATRCREATRAAFDAETVSMLDLLDAMNALKDAELAVAGGMGSEWRKALRRHLKSVQQLELKTKLLYQVGTKGGEAAQYAHAQRERLSAEAELLRAQIHEAGEVEMKASPRPQGGTPQKEIPGKIRLLKQ